MKRFPIAIVALALVWIAALLQRGVSLGWDEVEFFRATRWVAEGQVPFRDFWEHHTPLQWFLFAPVARLFATGAGTESVIAMRWAQVPLWIAALALLLRIARAAGVGTWERWTALAALLASSSFVRKALEYRVDTLGNALYVAGIAILVLPIKRRWIAFGALLSAAVLANMRLAPLVILTAGIASFWRGEERRWRFQPSALAMLGGVIGVAGAYLAYVYATGSMSEVVENLIRYNAAPGRERLDVATFGVTLLAPIWNRDLAAIALWLCAIAGTGFALREVRRPDLLTFLALLFLASIAGVGMLEVQYEYHFQTAYLLMLPLAAAALARLPRDLWRGVVVAVIAVGLVMNVANTIPGFGKALAYQDRVMTDVDRLTTADEHVFDGVGLALRRRPSYRYWFLPTGLRWMAAEKLVARYDAPQIAADPPAAILFDFRVYRWMEIFPALGKYAVQHYVPLYRDLWVPGMTATAEPRPRRFVWSAPRAGTYRVWSSELLVKHPWFQRPLDYALIPAPLAARYAIPLERLPAAPNVTLQWIVDGVSLPAGTRTIVVKKHSRVELLAMTSSGKTGVLLVPEGIGTICIGPEEEPSR